MADCDLLESLALDAARPEARLRTVAEVCARIVLEGVRCGADEAK